MNNEEPKQIKCYCGHTIMCDCSPKYEPKQTAIDWLIETLESDIQIDKSNMVTIKIHEHDYFYSKNIATQMFKERIMNAWVSGVVSDDNMTAEQYYNKTYI